MGGYAEGYANWEYVTYSSGKKTWADEIEEENVRTKSQGSVWDNFDMAKVSNAGFKFEYISPIQTGEAPIVEIKLEDIRFGV